MVPSGAEASLKKPHEDCAGRGSTLKKPLTDSNLWRILQWNKVDVDGNISWDVVEKGYVAAYVDDILVTAEQVCHARFHRWLAKTW